MCKEETHIYFNKNVYFLSDLTKRYVLFGNIKKLLNVLVIVSYKNKIHCNC